MPAEEDEESAGFSKTGSGGAVLRDRQRVAVSPSGIYQFRKLKLRRKMVGGESQRAPSSQLDGVEKEFDQESGSRAEGWAADMQSSSGSRRVTQRGELVPSAGIEQ